jgi:molybdopterin-guanine dinucleotide biosynthesis protein A
MLTVPCDTPQFPQDLAARLAQALEAEDADIAMAACLEEGRLQVQPVFCLLKTSLIESLVAFLTGGQRKIDKWTAQHRCATVVFDDAAAFFNANTAEDLRTLAAKQPPRAGD